MSELDRFRTVLCAQASDLLYDNVWVSRNDLTINDELFRPVPLPLLSRNTRFK
jgi:hypothetical protein